MRILYFADGGSVHTTRWAGWFAERGHEVHIASWTPAEDPRFTWHGLGRLREASPGLVRVPVIGGVARERFLAEEARRVVDEVRPDLVHGHYIAGYGHVASWSGFHPLVLTAWGSDIYQIAEQPRGQQRATRRALASADAITCDSADMRTRLLALGASVDRVSIVQHGVDTDVFRLGLEVSGLRAELGLSEQAGVLLSPRSLRPLYNIETIVRAAAMLPGVSLVLKDHMGDPDYRAHIRKLVDDLELADRTVWAGQSAHETMARYYNLADVVVSLASTDSSPVSVLEAMACGAAIVASDVPGVREWIEDGVNGFLAHPDDVEVVTAKVRSAISMDEAAIDAWARENRAAVESRAGYRANMEKAGALYARLAGDVSSGS